MNTDPEERWILKRSRHDPLVYPFRSEAEAADFAVEHGMVDWRATRSDDPAKEHEAVCNRSREQWPCKHVRLDARAKSIIAAANNRCARCGKQIGWLKVTFRGAGVIGEDVSYHGKLGACFNEAKRLAAETSDTGR